MSVIKMLGRIIAPKALDAKKGNCDQQKFDAELHDHTFGITSDPLMHFACAFSGAYF
jgi:hypothetical protein